MIWLTRIDGSPILVNPDHIVAVEPAHDTIVSLATGETLRIQESADELVRRTADWRRRLGVIDWLEPREAEG